MNKLILIFLLFASYVQSQNEKVYMNIYGGTLAEPKYVQSFIAGYESAGGDWTGHIKLDSNSYFQYSAPVRFCIDSGYNLIMNNTNASLNNKDYCDSFYYAGGQLVLAAGSNAYHDGVRSEVANNIIWCGAGDTNNVTGYLCTFYGENPYNDFPISSLTKKGGDTIEITVNTSANGGFYLVPNTMVILSGITGWSSNPAGQYIITKYVGGYNTFQIRHAVGSGTGVGGNAQINFQSYSTPYIAGQLLYIKSQRGGSWWDTRYAAMMTSTSQGVFSTYNGWGRIQVDSAIRYTGTVIQEPYNTMGKDLSISTTRTGNSLQIEYSPPSYALAIYLYNNSELIEVQYPIITYPYITIYNLTRVNSNQPHNIWALAVRGDQFFESGKIRVPYYKYSKIRLRSPH